MPLGSQFWLGNNWRISLLPITKMKAHKLCQSQVTVQPILSTISENTGKGLHKILLFIPQKPGFLWMGNLLQYAVFGYLWFLITFEFTSLPTPILAGAYVPQIIVYQFCKNQQFGRRHNST